MRRLAAPALVLVLALTGCTSQQTGDTDDFSGEEERVAEVVGQLSDAATRGEEAQVCDELLSEELQRSVAGGESCISEVEKAFDDADEAVIDVEDVTVEGETATAEVSSEQVGGAVRRTFSFVKEDGEWRIDSFG
jgi:hypothetical protein